MSDRQELIKRRDSVLGEARAVVEKCAREGREMARDEAEQVHGRSPKRSRATKR